MTEPAAPIDFYFDFSSPYGSLLSERIDELAARFDRRVHWHPILLGVVFQTTGSAPLTLQKPVRAAYWMVDFERSARFMGIPYRHPTHFPLPTQNAARAYYWLHGQDCALARRFAHATYRALFVDNRDISAPPSPTHGLPMRCISSVPATPRYSSTWCRSSPYCRRPSCSMSGSACRCCSAACWSSPVSG